MSVSAAPTVAYADVYVERLRIRNFRGIESCEFEFEPTLTLLVGRNNVGKSRILSALHLALGGRPADIDDFTVGSAADPEIDIVLAPQPPSAPGADEQFSDEVGRRFDRDVQPLSEAPFRERFAWRTHVRRSSEGFGARSESRVLTFDANASAWVERGDAREVTRPQRSVVASDLVNTGRDLTEELGRRGSGVRKVLSDLDVDEVTRSDLEGRLVELSSAIVGGSQTLASLGQALSSLNRAIGSIGAPNINPLPITLEELSRSLSIDFDSGHGSLPIRLHGAGARSLASLQIQGVLYERLLGADGGAVRPHPVTLVEEPEAHLHPQACAELPGLLLAIRGQVIASTHSAQVVTSSPSRSIRLLRESSNSLGVVDLGPADTDDAATHRLFRPSQHTEEIEKLKRLAERPFGEILFSNAIVMGDGATERGFLPPLLRHALGVKAHGVCVVDPDSMSTVIARAVGKFAKAIGLPLFLFADSDSAGVEAVEQLLDTGGGTANVAVVWAGKPDSTAERGVSGAVEAMMVDFDEDLSRAACELVRPDLVPVADVLTSMTKIKGAVGPTLADLLIEKYDDFGTWPQPIQDLIQLLEAGLS